MIVVGDDADTSFGLSPTLLAGGKCGIGEFVLKADGVLWGDMVLKTGSAFLKVGFHFFVRKSTVTADQFNKAADSLLGFLDGGGESFVIVTDVFEEFPIGDETFAIFSDEQGIAEFNFGFTFTPYDNLSIWLVVAEDFVFGGETTSADDALMGLLFKDGEEFEGVLDPVDDELGLSGAEVSVALAPGFQKIAVFAGVTGDPIGEVFEQSEDFLTLLLTINFATGITEVDANLVEFA